MPKDKSGLSFWKTVPGILKALTSFIAALVGLIVAVQSLHQNQPTPPVTPPAATNTPPPVPHYQVTGHVYNSDNDTALPLVTIAFVPAVPANAKPIYLATADNTGVFEFDSAEVATEQFPIRLQMTYNWDHVSRVIPWDFDISYLSDKTPLNLSMSLTAITNHTRVSILAPHLNLLLLTNSALKFHRPVMH